VPESAATQHIEASIKRTNDHPDNGSGLCCQYRFLDVELRIWANSGIAYRFARRWIFLKVGFNRITCREPQGRTISIDDVIIRAGR
jgi:hypothetical protein